MRTELRAVAIVALLPIVQREIPFVPRKKQQNKRVSIKWSEGGIAIRQPKDEEEREIRAERWCNADFVHGDGYSRAE
jgi:hypothetical protein